MDVCCVDFPSDKTGFQKLQEISRSKKVFVIVPRESLVMKELFFENPVVLKAQPLFATQPSSVGRFTTPRKGARTATKDVTVLNQLINFIQENLWHTKDQIWKHGGIVKEEIQATRYFKASSKAADFKRSLLATSRHSSICMIPVPLSFANFLNTCSSINHGIGICTTFGAE